MTSEHQPITPQELLESFKLKRDGIEEKMKAFPLDTDQAGFTRLYIQEIILDKQIKDLMDSIKPITSTGEIGQFTLTSMKDPDGRMITRKKK
jgi:hypothetical protein